MGPSWLILGPSWATLGLSCGPRASPWNFLSQLSPTLGQLGAPGGSPNPFWRPSRGTKLAQGGRKLAQEVPRRRKRAAGEPQGCPKMSQDGPNVAPRRPGSAQGDPNMAQESPKMGPKRGQSGPKMRPRWPRRGHDCGTCGKEGAFQKHLRNLREITVFGSVRASGRAQDGVKMVPIGPRWAKVGPRSSKATQEGRRRAPGLPQDEPRRPQCGSQEAWECPK